MPTGWRREHYGAHLEGNQEPPPLGSPPGWRFRFGTRVLRGAGMLTMAGS
jgi:hypothetical protein